METGKSGARRSRRETESGVVFVFFSGCRFFRGCLGGGFFFRFLGSLGVVDAGLDFELEDGFDVGMNFYGDVEIAGVLDGFFEVDGMAVDFDAFIREGFGDIHIGDGAECFAGGAGGEFEGDAGAFDFRSEIGGILEFPGFAFGAFALEGFEVAEMCLGGGIGFSRGQEEVVGETAFDVDDIGFDAEAIDLFFEDELDGGHDLAAVWANSRSSRRVAG